MVAGKAMRLSQTAERVDMLWKALALSSALLVVFTRPGMVKYAVDSMAPVEGTGAWLILC